jgi:RNA polymerase sigma-70 factor (ECF subfamily)
LAAAIENLMVTQAATGLETLFRSHHVRLLKAAYRITGSMADAEDVAQSVFLRFARGDVDAGRIANLESYLYRAAVNAALDVIRARGHRESVPVETADALQGNDSHSPERAQSSFEIRSWLRHELSKLHPRAAEMFILRYLEELDNPEIARMMNTTQAVVAVTLYRTRAKLRKELKRFMKGAL